MERLIPIKRNILLSNEGRNIRQHKETHTIEIGHITAASPVAPPPKGEAWRTSPPAAGRRGVKFMARRDRVKREDHIKS